MLGLCFYKLVSKGSAPTARGFWWRIPGYKDIAPLGQVGGEV